MDSDSSELIARAIQIGARLRMFNGGGVDCETDIRVILELSRGILAAAGATPSPPLMPWS